jgi:amidohydrolase
MNSKWFEEKLNSTIGELRGRAVAISAELHANPELALCEYQASEVLQDWLKDEGFAVTAGVADLPTAFVASWGSGSPRIAVMAEYDALPGLGHGCGHNLIAAGGLTAGIAMRRVLAEAAPAHQGTILVIGTPGEEGAGGKAIELEHGVFDGVDAAMMFHPADRTILTRRMLACLHLSVRFHGVASHAAKNPESGRNALAAMIAFFVGIDGLRQHIGSSARIHGVITNGGAAANVVPDLTEADFYVRDKTLIEAEALAVRVRACAEGAAMMTGTTAELSSASPNYAHLHSNQTMADRLEQYLTGLGYPAEAPSPDDATGSTDAGNVSLVLPTIHPFIKVAARGTPSHSDALRKAAIEPPAHDAMIAIAQAMAALGLDLLTEPELLAAASVEFRQGT